MLLLFRHFYLYADHWCPSMWTYLMYLSKVFLWIWQLHQITFYISDHQVTFTLTKWVTRLLLLFFNSWYPYMRLGTILYNRNIQSICFRLFSIIIVFACYLVSLREMTFSSKPLKELEHELNISRDYLTWFILRQWGNNFY